MSYICSYIVAAGHVLTAGIAVFVTAGPSYCTSPLGLESGSIPDANFTSSSDADPSKASHYGRLNSEKFHPTTLAWSAANNDDNQWLGVEVGEAVKLTGIAIQGLHGSTNWVESFTLSYSNDGVNFTAVQKVRTPRI